MLGIFAPLLYSLAAAIGAYFLRVPMESKSVEVRLAGFWIIVQPIMFLIPWAMFTVLALIPVTLFFFMPKGAFEKAVVATMLTFALPLAMAVEIPMVGLNYLLTANPQRVIALLILLPLVFVGRSRNQKIGISSLDVWVIIFVTLIVLLDFRGNTFTNGLRGAVYTLLLWLIPYFALSRTFIKFQDMRIFLCALLFLFLFLGFIATIAALKQYNFYSVLHTSSSVFTQFSYRGGLLRVGATMSTTLLAFCMGAGLIMLEYLRKRIKIPFWKLWAARIILLFAAFMTGSRGGWLSVAFLLGAYLFFNQANRGVKIVLLAMAASVGIFGIILFNSGDFTSVDQYNTFSYRQELLYTSMEQIETAPLLGDEAFLESPIMAVMKQGQGIIDIVNSYLQIALEYGLITLFVFVMMFISSIWALFRISKSYKLFPEDKIAEIRGMRAIMLSMVIGFALLILTVSLVAHSPSIMVMLLAITRGFTGQLQNYIKKDTSFFEDRKTILTARQQQLERRKAMA